MKAKGKRFYPYTAIDGFSRMPIECVQTDISFTPKKVLQHMPQHLKKTVIKTLSDLTS